MYTLHWIYFIIMAIGALYFYLLSRNPSGVPRYEYVIAIFIPCWSGTAYMSIALGQGFLEMNERTIYFARYLDWVVTTPLLLLALSLTAMFYKKQKDKAIIGSLIGADVFMILTGLIADFSEGAQKYIWYSLGVIALVIILYIIWYPLRQIATTSSEELGKHYTRTALYLTLFWIAYPTVWLLGPSGLGLTQSIVDLLAFIILPIFSKVGFSILDLAGLRRLGLTKVNDSNLTL
ncbi:bacteriorhodopsin [Aquibacillus koreensis]|uniref:Bacteriorhodopsin n=1 Tax=Aquibacillus koreensis TaxID=279446 RepID=A0A9X3WGN3_9BACI|nr:bacteriorhodopsin [Aquibacillus koreensis]MCT2536507.1 bacteriorhodopsin [Aquibacillus koreensis]MDC3419405.1 bacteriorhodopsin [Aquibacillus koreensis]